MVSAAVAACGTVRFYGQAIGGQVEIVRRSRPTEEVLADARVAEDLKEKLRQVEGIRKFASERLALPGDESYGKYADLGREAVSWVVYAAPEFSLEPKRWWYPTLGRLDYRGYFREADAEALARRLEAEGLDAYVGGVDAYSTLGWFHDPVLNTFVDAPDVDLAELIFHELTHRRLFRKGDTVFNESLANAVAEEGVRRWLRHEKRVEDLARYEGRLVRRRQFYDEIERTRRELEGIYGSGLPEGEMRAGKRRALARLQAGFRELRRKWGGRGLDAWLREDINNAHLVSLITYHHHIPEFEALLRACGGDLEVFFAKAADLKLEKP